MGIETAAAIAAIVGTGYGIYSGERSAAAQADAQNRAKKSAADQQKAADEAANRANQKSADTTGALNAARQASGSSGTMLTGPQGVDPSALSLGKTSLLGM